jgi:hypothetical protein
MAQRRDAGGATSRATGTGSRTAARTATGTRADRGGPASGGDSVAAATAGAGDLRLIRFAVDTPHGSAEVALDLPKAARGLLALGHGASGSVDAPDLVAVRDAAVAVRLAVARITQPYRVQGRRAPPPAAQLDAAWIAAITETRRRAGAKLPVVVGGRSSGARVAARTAAGLGAAGVLALAFPLHPPGKPESSRAGELDPSRPTLVINGDRDPFGLPGPTGEVRVIVRTGERHDLRRDPAGVAQVAIEWVIGLLQALR